MRGGPTALEARRPVRGTSGASARRALRSARRALRSARGQATVETVAILPLCITVALAIGHVLAAGLAHELAGHAAEAGAIAAIRGADATEAVRASLPEWADDRVAVRIRDREVRVQIRPPAVVPGIADALAASATAHAGPREEPAEAATNGAREGEP